MNETLRKKPLTRRERERKIKQIYREMEAKKRELGLRAPAIRRGPIFYVVVLLVLLIVGSLLIQAAGKGGGRRTRDGRPIQAEQSVAALAEALGRFKFHCGVYPTAEEGLQALALKYSEHAGWVGPYIPKLLPDPWKRAYVYEPPATTNGTPVVLSLGPDGLRGTADDILPDPELFRKPFRDTTWTNDWAPFQLRGYIVVPGKRETEGGR
ncbi:MAG: type II secretion system protein GspG [Kiritimatiellia bacterium]